MDFFTDIIAYRFLQYAALAALLCSIASGLIGSFVVVRKTTYFTGAIAHSTLGGIGFAEYASKVLGWSWFNPLIGAFLSALVASGVIAVCKRFQSERDDTILSAIWALGMAIGVTFLMLTPGYAQDLSGYLFGEILLVNHIDLITMLILVVTMLIFARIGFEGMVSISFNQELAELRGIRAQLYEFVFTLLTAVTVVMLVRIAGVVLVIALLTLPAATALRFQSQLKKVILLATGISLFTMLTGLWISYEADLPTGATIIEVSVLVYILASVFKGVRK